MTTLRRGVGLTPMETRRDVIVRAAVLADELGYETFAVPEGWGLDSTPVLTEIALRTARIHLASGVLSVWGRTPATLAMTAATLHQVSGGRYVLGLGASTRALAEGFHDIPFERPAAKLRDVVTKVRALLGRPARSSSATRGRAPAAPGPAARPRGTHLGRRAGPAHDPSGRRTRRRLDPRAGGPGSTVAGLGGPASAGCGKPPHRTRDRSRWRPGPSPSSTRTPTPPGTSPPACTAWYLSAMGDVYARSVSGQGYAAQVSAIIAANPRPSPRRGTVPPSARVVLDQLAACGTRDQVHEQLEPWDHAADIVTIMLPPGLPWPTIEATLRAAAPSIRPGRTQEVSVTTERVAAG